MSKITLNNVGSVADSTTATNTINANNAVVQTAFDNTLSRDGTSPNQMNSSLDMNSNQVINLPNPATTSSPLRLSDLNSFVGGGTVTNIPSGGTTGQILSKTSNTNYVIGWTDESTKLVAGTNIVLTGTTPTTIATTAIPVFTTIAGGSASNSTLTLKSTTSGSPSGDSVSIQGTTTTIRSIGGGGSTINLGVANTTGAIINIAGTTSGSVQLTASSAASGALTLPSATDTLVGKATTDILTNKTLTNPAIIGTATNDNAAAGNVGEYIESIVPNGSAVALTTNVGKTVTSISLTAGDWDVDVILQLNTTATTSFTQFNTSLSLVNNTLDITTGRNVQNTYPATVPGVGSNTQIIPPYRFSLSGTTTIFLVSQCVFTASTLSAWGLLRARRIR